MKKLITVIHTSLVSIDHLKELFAEIIPHARVQHIIDDSLLAEVSSVGHITPGIVNRMCKYFDAAASIHSDLIFTQCSSVGEAAEIAARTVDVPSLRIDQPMAEKAVSLGSRIGVIATVASTVDPSCNLIRQVAAREGKEVEVVPYLIDGALKVLMTEGQARHNAMVRHVIKQCEQECDVIVLAQGSMVVLIPDLADIQKPVLTSPRLAVEKAREMLSFLPADPASD